MTGLLRQLAISAALLLAIFCGLLPAQAQVGSRLSVSPPNGYAAVTVEDMRLKSVGGDVRWTRVWDSQEWKFNPQWESLSQSWKNLTGTCTQTKA